MTRVVSLDLNGFSLTIHLHRDAKGHWRYSQTGTAMVGN